MNVFELCAKLKLDKDEYETALDGAKKGLGKVGEIMGAIGKAGAVAIGAGATAVGALGKQAVEAYADYEQLVGGVETLFGAGGQSLQEFADAQGKAISEVEGDYYNLREAQKDVMINAKWAFQTAGLSANEYMETVTGFSASLIASLGGDTLKASEVADKAIVDMSDNANKMGSSMESIQNAYAGFAKQNYTMLDNLKLGYGGTKEEMARLLSDAEKLPEAMGRKFDLENYADVIEAIHVVQENMGIAGTTAKEAGTTISGSIGMMKGAWANLVAEIAKPDADIGDAIANLMTTIVGDGTDTNKGVIGNLLPAVKNALSGIGELIKGVVPVIKDVIPIIVTDVLPPLLEAGAELISALGGALLDNIDMIIDTGVELLMGLLDGLVNNLPKIIEATIKIVTKLVDALTQNGNIEKLTKGALQLIVALAKGLIQAIPQLLGSAEKIVKGIGDGIVSFVKEMSPVGGQLVEGLWNGIKKAWDGLTKRVKQLASDMISAVKAIFGIHSPSKVFSAIGEMCVAGLEDGSEGLFSTKGLTAKVSASVDSKTEFTGGNNDVLSLLKQYLPAIASGNQIVLDTGALVGSTAKLYNAELGRMALRGSNL